MSKYTLEKLKEINLSYNAQHRITESDVEKANAWVELIENSRSEYSPQIGDIVEFTNKYGDYYRNAHIENMYKDDNTMHICEHPQIPFIGLYNNRIYTSTSGGAWDTIPSNVKFIGQRKKLFCDWGHCGACANGAIEFHATVNVWEYVDCELEFTTKTHNKYYISINHDIEYSKYKYIGDGHAYENDKMFSAWLQTFRGIVKKGYWQNQLIVWTHKEESINCKTVEEYNNINGINDTWLCNGIRECKRIYDNENHKVLTYIPPYDKLYELDFGLDWRTHSRLEYALKNPMPEYDISNIIQELVSKTV